MGGIALRAAMVLGLTALASSPALAGEWQISPSVGLFESFTDNAALSPPGKENWDFVTNLTPAISVHGEGARFSLDLDASLNTLVYARDGSLDALELDLAEANKTELIPEELFVDTRAVVTQIPAQPGQAVSGSQNTSQSGSTVATLLLSPYWRDHFGDFGDSVLRYTFSQVLSPSGGVGNSTNNELTAGFASGARFNRLRWSLTGDAAFGIQGGGSNNGGSGNNSSSGTRNTSHLTAKADAEYVLTREWSLLGGFGYERIQDPTLVTEPNGPIGDAGVRWQPGPRLSVVMQYNHRFDDNFLSGALSYQIGANTLLTASYTEGLQTSQDLLTQNVGFLTVDEAGNFIDARTRQLFSLNTGAFGIDNSAFREKRFNADFSTTFTPNLVRANAFYVNRQGGNFGNETGFGGSVSWTRDITELDQVAAVARYGYLSFQSSGNTVNNTFGLGLSWSHSLSATLQLVFLYDFTDQLSNNASDRFHENVVSVGLVKTFK
jgi:uncharacterized protein (PEP-CTERM system associated)